MAVLEADSSALGDIHRRLVAGESPEQIQAARGAGFPNFVYQYQASLRAIVEGDLPAAPTMAIVTARRVKRVMRSPELSADARNVLRSNLELLETYAADQGAKEVEDAEALQVTERAEAQEIPGVYVYALPHYIRYPYDAESGRTLMKVGRSDRDVITRFRHQTRTTALPEEPVLLRIYPARRGTSSVVDESSFHGLLEAADHERSTARTGGTEWFLTSLRFLDRIASTLGLESLQVYDPGVDD